MPFGRKTSTISMIAIFKNTSGKGKFPGVYRHDEIHFITQRPFTFGFSETILGHQSNESLHKTASNLNGPRVKTATRV